MAVRESLLNTISSIATSDFVRAVTSAGASSKVTVSNLAKAIVENYTGSTLAGSAQSVKSAVDTLSTDYIVEQGTSGIWTYRKWSSGVAECWGTHTQTISGVSATAPFSGYKYDFSLITFPSSFFVAVPTVTVSTAVGSVYNATSYCKAYQTNVSVSATSNSNASQSCTATIHAIGRWK